MMVFLMNGNYAAMTIMIAISAVISVSLNIQFAFADNFDLKTTLLKHREQHTNHLDKDFAYDHFRRLDRQRIEKLQSVIMYYERRLLEIGSLEEGEHMALASTKAHHAKIVSESFEEKQERYAELHEAMQSEHTLGLNDLDFTRTGI